MYLNHAYFALRANCLSLGHTHASLDVLGAVLPLRRGLEFVLDEAAADPDTFFCGIPGAVDKGPVCLPLCEKPPVGLVTALLDLIDAMPLLLVAWYMLSTDARWQKIKIPYIFI